MIRPALFVAVTALLAAFLGGAGALLARSQDQDVNVWLSMGTALVIGTFLAFLILGPRAGKDEAPEAEGFAVVAREEVKPVMVPRDEATPRPADETAGPESPSTSRPGEPPK